MRRELLPPEAADAMLAWPHSGFHVHHHVRIDDGDPDGRAHVARYAARAPVALSRITYDADTDMVSLASDKAEGPDVQCCPRCRRSRIVAKRFPISFTICRLSRTSSTLPLDMSIPSTYRLDMSKKQDSLNMSRQRPKWAPNHPFDALPTLPPATDLETRPVLRRCIEARAALAELKRAAGLIPNPAMLINTLPVLEARSSSEIENVVTTADRLFEHLDRSSSADPATKEALRYREALLEGFREIQERPITTSLAERICARIKDVDMSVRKIPGTALANPTTGQVIYTPPVGENRIRDLLANWERYLNAPSEVDPLIRMTVAHYQFEAIHPFTDGNGRTGRVLNSLYLIQEGLLTQPILYLSRYVIENKAEYYRLLLEVTRDERWEAWTLYMLEAVEETSRWTLRTIEAIQSLHEATAGRVREVLPKIYSRELIDVLFQQPYCRIGDLVAADIAKRQTASTYLKELVAIDVLEERAGGREKLFVNRELMRLLREPRD